MKRICIIYALLPLLIACEVESSEFSPLNSAKLKSYSVIRMTEYVAMPVEALEFALELDSYLKLSDIGKETDRKFFGNCIEESYRKYRISYNSPDEYRITSMSVDTGGMSIREEGSVWKISYFSMYGNDFSYSNLDYHYELPIGSEIYMMSQADSTWAVSLGESGASKMKMRPMYDGLYEWVVESQGKEVTETGLSAEFSTIGTFVLKEKYLESGEKTNLYDGQFNVDIFRDGQPYDYCRLKFSHGMRANVETSR